MLKMLTILSAVASVLAGGADRRVVGRTLISDHDPQASLVLNGDYAYLGKDRWTLHAYDDDCEMHLFVQSDPARNVKRLFWVQFEAYFPDRPELHHSYDSPQHARVGDLDFYQDTWVSDATSSAEDESDTAHFRAMVRAHGLSLPKAMAYVRFVHLPEPTRRKEMMIIYAEALAPGETVAAARGSDRMDALSRRARDQVSLTR